MKIQYNMETEILKIKLEGFEIGAVNKNDLIDALEENEIEFSDFVINDIVSKLKVNSELIVDIGSYSKEDINKEEDDLAYVDETKHEDIDSYEEAENEGNVKTNTVGNWFASYVAQGYRIAKGQVLRGQVVEEVEYKGDLLVRRQHLCGPQIKVLKMIADEITPLSTGCAGREILSVDSIEKNGTIFCKLYLTEDITVRYKLVRAQSVLNDCLEF